MELKNETKGVIFLPNNQALHPGKAAEVDDKVANEKRVKAAIERGHISRVKKGGKAEEQK